MYLDHFGLDADPFSLSPDLNLLFVSHSHEETMAHLAYGLEQGEEIILLSGQVGMGKTLALHSLLTRISKSFTCVMVSSTTLRFRELLKMVLFELKVPFEPHADLADLLESLKSRMAYESSANRKLLLIVDEAQNLDFDTLENLRLLQTLAPPGQNNLQIVLSGQPGLETTIARPELLQLQQRIRVHYRMEPLTRSETEEYLNHRTTICGQERRLFDEDAVDGIFSLSGGNPRLVNHRANQAMLSAYVAGRRVVSARDLVAEDDGDVAPLASAAAAGTEPAAAAPHLRQRPHDPSDSQVAVKRADARASGGHGARRTRRLLIIAAAVAVLATTMYLLWPSIGSQILSGTAERSETHSRMREGVPKASLSEGSGTEPMMADATIDANPAAPGSGNVRVGVSETSAPAADSSRSEAVADTLPAPAVSAVEADPSHAEAARAQGGEPVASVQVASPHAHSGEYGVHVASFRQQERALALVRTLVGEGYPAEHRDNEVAGLIWYRVCLGPYPDEATARAAASAILASGLTTYTKVVEF